MFLERLLRRLILQSFWIVDYRACHLARTFRFLQEARVERRHRTVELIIGRHGHIKPHAYCGSEILVRLLDRYLLLHKIVISSIQFLSGMYVVR